MKRAPFFLAIMIVLGLFMGSSPSAQAALTLCRWRCVEVRAPSGSCTDSRWVFTNTQEHLFAAGASGGLSAEASCTSGCRQRCETACPGSEAALRSIGTDATSGRSFRPGSTYCIVGQPPPIVIPDASCYSGAPVWNPPTCIEPPAAPTAAPTVAPSTGAGTCVFKCERGTARTAYTGERIACGQASDCVSRCNDACRNSSPGAATGSGAATCVLQSSVPAPNAADTPKCEVAPQGSPTTLTNPLNTTDIGEVIARFIRAITGIAGSMALLMLVVGGVMWMTAEGSDRVGTAQTIIKNACLGLMLIFLAYSFTSLFLLALGL